MSKKLRPLGDITGDLEPLLEELVDAHGCQVGEVLALIHCWLMIHRPGAFEQYNDGSGTPVFYYGPKQIETEK